MIVIPVGRIAVVPLGVITGPGAEEGVILLIFTSQIVIQRR